MSSSNTNIENKRYKFVLNDFATFSYQEFWKNSSSNKINSNLSLIETFCHNNIFNMTQEDQKFTCGICFEFIKIEWEIDSCKHMFCFKCIKTWGKSCTTCPICRREFSEIFLKNKAKGKKRFHLKKKTLSVNQVDISDSSIRTFLDVCEICHIQDRFSDLILCVGCNVNLSHYQCDNLASYPETEWYCRSCR
jgi:hypothetical protein